jgi:hypothetical protein
MKNIRAMEHLIEGPVTFFEEFLKKYRYRSQYIQKETEFYQNLEVLRKSSITILIGLIELFLKNFPLVLFRLNDLI